MHYRNYSLSLLLTTTLLNIFFVALLKCQVNLWRNRNQQLITTDNCLTNGNYFLRIYLSKSCKIHKRREGGFICFFFLLGVLLKQSKLMPAKTTPSTMNHWPASKFFIHPSRRLRSMVFGKEEKIEIRLVLDINYRSLVLQQLYAGTCPWLFEGCK